MREEVRSREDEYQRARNHKPVRYSISDSLTPIRYQKSYRSLTFLSVLCSRPPPPTQHYENINPSYAYVESPYTPRPPSRPEAAYKGSHCTNAPEVSRFKFDRFVLIYVSFISSSFRCLLQTVTISLHCCPITSPFAPLLCESIEKEAIQKLLWVHEAFGGSYWHFNLIFPPSFSAHRIRWAVVVSSCCEWFFYPGVINYWATGTVPVRFSCFCLAVDEWTGRDLLHSPFKYPFSFHPSRHLYSSLVLIPCCIAGYSREFLFF